jgi:hypothetical protein
MGHCYEPIGDHSTGILLSATRFVCATKRLQLLH